MTLFRFYVLKLTILSTISVIKIGNTLENIISTTLSLSTSTLFIRKLGKIIEIMLAL